MYCPRERRPPHTGPPVCRWGDAQVLSRAEASRLQNGLDGGQWPPPPPPWALIIAALAWPTTSSDSSLSVRHRHFHGDDSPRGRDGLTGYLSDRFDRSPRARRHVRTEPRPHIVLVRWCCWARWKCGTLVVLAFVNGVGARARAHMPAAQALIPNVVPRPLLLNAIALNQATKPRRAGCWTSQHSTARRVRRRRERLRALHRFYGREPGAGAARAHGRSTGEMDRRKGVHLSKLTEGLFYVYPHAHHAQHGDYRGAPLRLTMAFESLLPVLSARQLGSEEATAFHLPDDGRGRRRAGVRVDYSPAFRANSGAGRAFLYPGQYSADCVRRFSRRRSTAHGAGRRGRNGRGAGGGS